MIPKVWSGFIRFGLALCALVMISKHCSGFLDTGHLILTD